MSGRYNRPYKVLKVRYKDKSGIKTRLIFVPAAKRKIRLDLKGRVLHVSKLSLLQQHHIGEFNLTCDKLMREFSREQRARELRHRKQKGQKEVLDAAAGTTTGTTTDTTLHSLSPATEAE